MNDMSEIKRIEEKGTQRIVFFLCSIIAPLWGVGYVLPFLMAVIFVVLRDRSLLFGKWMLKGWDFPLIMAVFSFFLGCVLFSSLYHIESKWGSTDGFWVVLSSFLFFILGSLIGFSLCPKKLVFYIKFYLTMSFILIVFTTLNWNSFKGGAWGEMNDLTALTLMISGALFGVFTGNGKAGIRTAAFCILPPLVYILYFSVRISSSDAALFLSVALFFLLSVFAPQRRAFAMAWTFFLLLICVGLVYLVFGKPLDFKALLNANRLESFLSFRPQSWLASLSIMRNNPWLGIGSGLYKQFYEALLPLLPGKKVILAHSHCLYLVHFVAHGAIAGFAFITLIALNLRMVLSSLMNEDTAPVALMVAGIWFFYLSYGLVELAPASREMVPLVWGSSGLLAGLLSRVKNNTSTFAHPNSPSHLENP